MVRRRVAVESNGWVEATLFRLVDGEPVPPESIVGARVEETAFCTVDDSPDFHLKRPELLVVKFPGTAGRAERSSPFPAHLASASTAEVWTWNPPGYGGSPGVATLSGIARAAGEFIQEIWRLRGGPTTRLWINGNSLGCVSGIYAARVLSELSSVPVGGMILRNPPPLVSLVASHDAWWNLWRGGRWVSRGVPPEMDAVAQIGNLLAPVLFIESAEDQIVPPRFQAEVRGAHRGHQRIMQLIGADHGTPLDDSHRSELDDHLAWLWSFG